MTRNISSTCKILVADAMGGRKILMKTGKGLPPRGRELAIVREVFGNVDAGFLHDHLECEWYRVSTRTRGRPTCSELSNLFWTLFLRRVYRDLQDARLDGIINVSRSLVVSGGGVGTRRSVRPLFFTERGVSPEPLKRVLQTLVSSDKTFVRDWFAAMRWDYVGGGVSSDRSDRSETRTTASSSCGSSSSTYMEHPLDMPIDAPVDFIEVDDEGDDVRRDDVRRDRLFECAYGCGRVWDGNSQCPCFIY